ncbi:response regulator transcription factor [Sphaerotilaceae bacterium SBD11-9]
MTAPTMPPMNAITVALVEDDPRTRERFTNVIGAEPSLRFAFGASTASELLAWFAENVVDVLLVDLGLPDMAGVDLIRRCCRMQPACAVMVITMFGDEANMLQAFEAGARGYLLKDGTETDLAAHVLSLHAGGSPMSPIIARQLLARWQADAPSRPAAARPAARADLPEALSRRESQVLDLVARGFTYPEIAQQMAVSVTTVQTHVRNIYGKLGVHSKTEAVYEARQFGLLP